MEINTENKNEIFAVFEAILFASGEPVEIEKIAEAVELSLHDTMKLINEFEAMLKYSERGVTLVYINESVQLATKAEYHEIISKIMMSRASKNLSQSALEVLSIIAYNQPVTKAAIDNIRGVDSYNSLCRLTERELIEVRGRLNTIGHPKIYGTTDEFLRMFGLVTLDDLPKAQGQTLENISSEKELTIFDTPEEPTQSEELDPEASDFEI